MTEISFKKYGHTAIKNILNFKTKLQQFYFTDPVNNKRKMDFLQQEADFTKKTERKKRKK